MKRYDEDFHGDDHFMTEAPDGRWVEADEVLALEAAHTQLRAAWDSADAGRKAAEAELTRWRAMFSTPEIAARHIEEINLTIDRLTVSVNRQNALVREAARRIEDLEATVERVRSYISYQRGIGLPNLADALEKALEGTP